MIYFDTGKSKLGRPKSGLVRVGQQILAALSAANIPVQTCAWNVSKKGYVDAKRRMIHEHPGDMLVVPDVFCELERPRYDEWLKRTPMRTLAIYHDAIPLQHPEITWPKSVARHPRYMKMLTAFKHVCAVSQKSQAELEAYWSWCGFKDTPPVSVIPSGADGLLSKRPALYQEFNNTEISVLSVGILEPRKNQMRLMRAAKKLWDEGLSFKLILCGRINPHFGKPIAKHIRELKKAAYAIEHHEGLSDEALAALYQKATFTAFPSIAEGNGLPVLESLHLGVPVLCGPVPAAKEWAQWKGCQRIEPLSVESIATEMRTLITNTNRLTELGEAIRADDLPKWEDAATVLAAACKA